MTIRGNRQRTVVGLSLVLLILAGIFSRSNAVGEDTDPLDEDATAAGSISSAKAAAQVSVQTSLAALASDEVFGTYEGYNLDHYVWSVLYRPGGPVQFPISLTRVLSRSGQDYAGLIVGQPQLVIRAFDVDYPVCSTACGPCEYDGVYLNGHFLGFLQGSTQAWSETRFNIPVEWFQNGWVADAFYRGPGTSPISAANTVTIDVDQAASPCHWLTWVDYGEIQVRAMRPAVLIHGFLSDHTTWDTFRTLIPGNLSEAFDVSPTGTTLENALALTQTILPQALTGFGVEKVNLIGHSKGGMDASRAAWRNLPKIASLITLGSPLQGSEYADDILDNHPVLRTVAGPFGTEEFRVARRQEYYRDIHPSPLPGLKEFNFTGTQYTQADTDCLGRYTGNGHLVFADLNDGLVQWNRSFEPWSPGYALALSDAHNAVGLVMPRAPAPVPRPMLDDANVALWVLNLMRLMVMGPSASAAAASEGASSEAAAAQAAAPASNVSRGPQHTVTFSRALGSGGTWSPSMPIEYRVQDATFSLSYQPQTARLQVSLQPPSGSPIPLTRNPDLPLYAYRSSTPTQGSWIFHVVALDPAEIETVAEITTGEIYLDASTDKEEYAAHERIDVTAHLIDSPAARISNASVTATAISDSGQREEIVLQDQGGGTFTAGFYTGPKGARWKIKVKADGVACTVGGSPEGSMVCNSSFQREATIPMAVAAPDSADVLGFSQGVPGDADGDGLYDSLTFNVSMEGKWTGAEYEIFAKLVGGDDASGVPIETLPLVATTVTVMQLDGIPGPQQVPLVFDGRAIHDSGLIGPYTLAEISLIHTQEELLEERVSGFLASTGPLRFYEFEGPGLTLGAGRDRVLDIDGDGQWDQLIIELGLSANPGYQGTYSAALELRDLDEHLISTFSGATYVPVGAGSIQISFPGQAIAANGADGPFRVANFRLTNAANPQLRLESGTAFFTSRRRYCEFQGAAACVVPGGGGAGGGAGGHIFPIKEE